MIILTDKYTEDEINIELFKDERIKIIETGELPPAIKRAMGVKKSSGTILAFLDDDTYPEKDWLLNALRAIESTKVNALGGPAVNTPKDNFSKQISGLIYSSTLMSGKHKARYIPDKVQYVNDYPSCND